MDDNWIDEFTPKNSNIPAQNGHHFERENLNFEMKIKLLMYDNWIEEFTPKNSNIQI